MRYLLLLLALGLVCKETAQAQSERIQKLRKAHELYTAKNYAAAAAEYEPMMQSQSSAAIMGVDAKANLAHCYVELDKPERAEAIYREIMPDLISRPESYLYYAQALLLSGKIDQAKEYALLYSSKRPDDPRGAALKTRCDMIENIRPLYPIVEVRAQPNVSRRKSDEFASSFCGNNVVFASDRILKGSVSEWTEQERTYLDLYISAMDEDGQLAAPKKFPFPINSPSRHDGPASFTRDGKTVYYSQSTRPSAGSEQLSLQIVVSHYEDNRWTSPEVLPINEPNYIFTHPCISADGKQLYFTSNRPGGFGGTDIWVSTYRDGRWTNPRNVGNKVNTDKNEGYAFIHPSGVLFFASKGHANFGGYDIFRSRPVGNGTDWLDAENLGRPLNSHKDDTYLLLSDAGFTGFITSRRDGDDNVYQFELFNVDSLRVSPDLEALSAPDFLDLEELPVELAAVDSSNMEAVEHSMYDWRVPTTSKKTVDDENFVDKMLSGGGSLTSDPIGKNPPIGNDNLGHTTHHTTGGHDGGSGHTMHTNKDNGHNTTTDFGKPTNTVSEVFGGGTATTDPNRRPESNPTLTVLLHVVDGNIGAPLPGAKVSVTNLFTKETKEYSLQSDGTVQISLRPDQKYQVRGTCNNYYASELPIATIGAYYTETQKAYLPLVKKN